jgi:hypothetical protein
MLFRPMFLAFKSRFGEPVVVVVELLLQELHRPLGAEERVTLRATSQ